MPNPSPRGGVEHPTSPSDPLHLVGPNYSPIRSPFTRRSPPGKQKMICQTSQAPSQISVHSDERIDLKALVGWLRETVELSINYDVCRCEPLG